MPARCSFCSRLPGPGAYVVAGPKGVGICDECAATAHTVAQEALRPHGTDRLVTGIGRLMTNDPSWGNFFGVIEDAAVAIRKGRVAWVGSEEELPPQLEGLPRLDCGGRVAAPGFVDAYSQVAGGTGSSGTPNGATEPETAADWAGRLLAGGATCLSVSVQSRGDPLEDQRRLSTAAMLGEQLPLKVVTSWTVGPEAGFPSPYDPSARSILRDVSQYASGLSVTVGSGGFSSADVRKLCASMGNLRKRVRLHGRPGIPSDVVRSVRPLAVQDMTELDESTLEALRLQGGAVVVLPAASLRSRLPIRSLMELGIPVALGSDCLPGERSVTSMPFLAWAASEAGEVPIETALWCATFGGAQALGDTTRGWLGRGAVGDMVIMDVGHFYELAYHPDLPTVWELIREGDLTAVGQSG